VKKKKKKPAAAYTQVQQCLAHLRKQLRPLLNARLAKEFSLLHPKIFLSLMTAQLNYHTSNAETEQDSSDEDTNIQSVTAMQALMADYLPAEMKVRWEASDSG
jgi:hypothetical protein